MNLLLKLATPSSYRSAFLCQDHDAPFQYPPLALRKKVVEGWPTIRSGPLITGIPSPSGRQTGELEAASYGIMNDGR